MERKLRSASPRPRARPRDSSRRGNRRLVRLRAASRRAVSRKTARATGLLPEARTEPRVSESFSSIYFATGSDVAVDGGDLAGGLCRLYSIACLGAARGGLPDDSGGDVLSGRQSGRDGVGSYRSAGAAVRPSARPE